LADDCCSIESFFFEYLASYNIPTAFKQKASPSTIELSVSVDLPFFVRIINYVDEPVATLCGRKPGDAYSLPVLEYLWTANPRSPLSFNHLIGLGIIGVEELKTINRVTSKINALMKSFFERRDKLFLSAECSFGIAENKLVLTGRFSPQCILFSSKNNEVNPATLFVPFDNTTELKKYIDTLLKAIKN
jgi:phosphoribosylaminoimidazole-succinocarboxamide synthase